MQIISPTIFSGGELPDLQLFNDKIKLKIFIN